MFTHDELAEIHEYLTDYRRHLEDVVEDVKHRQKWRDPDRCRLCHERERDYAAQRLADARKAIRSIGALLDKMTGPGIEEGENR